MAYKILTALDGTIGSEGAIPYLETLLRGTDADVTLVKVTAPDSLKEKQAARAYLKGMAADLERKGAPVDFVILSGDPATQIARFAKESRYDLVLLCTRNRKGVARVVFGSVAEEILRLASVPILIVRPRGKEALPPALRRIVAPLDGSHRSAAILPAVARLAKAHGARISFVTAVSPTGKEELPVEIVSENLFREQRKLKAQGLDVEVSILYGDPGRKILAHAKELKADLIALSTHGRTGLARLRYGSVAEKVLREGKVPLLVLRTVAVPKTKGLTPAGVRGRRRALKALQATGDMLGKGPYNR